jgi:hypothetical protein
MAIKKWCIWATDGYKEPNAKAKVSHFVRGTVVEVVDTVDGWSHVQYTEKAGKKMGWVRDAYLEDLVQPPDFKEAEVEIPEDIKTPDLTDAAQFITWEGKRKTEMCGEFCTAFIAQKSIANVLTDWGAHSEEKKLYQEIFDEKNWKTKEVKIPGKGKVKQKVEPGTDLRHLRSILKVNGYKEEELKNFTQGFEDEGLNDGGFKLATDRFKRMLDSYYLIVGVGIQRFTGILGGEIRHWVVLDKIEPEDVKRGRVEIYNPFYNRRERYSFEALIETAGGSEALWRDAHARDSIVGLWVKRDQNILEKLENWKEQLEDFLEKFKGFVVAIGPEFQNPNPARAAQYIFWKDKKKVGAKPEEKHNLCGEFCVAFIGGDSIETFLDKWAGIDEPSYNKFVIGNKATLLNDIKSMLKVYYKDVTFTEFKEGLRKLSPELKINDINSYMTPGRMKRMLEDHFLIAHVGLRDGKLCTKAGGANTYVGHWVLLDKIEPEGVDRGWVEVYNPFPNKRQLYAYTEFKNFCAIQYNGLWVKRPLKGVADNVHL